MVNAPLPAQERHEPAQKTLAAVLRTDGGTPESEWVGLLQAITAGDPLALRTLYDRSHRLVFTLVVRLVQNRASAEEITVDVFHEIWRRAGHFDPATGTVIAWIMNQARSRAIDRLRFEHRKKRAPPAYLDAAEPRTQDAADEHLETRDQERALQAALTTLTPSEREAIETAFFGEHSYSQVAATLNEPLGTIKTRIRSGLLKLRQLLEPRQGDL